MAETLSTSRGHAIRRWLARTASTLRRIRFWVHISVQKSLSYPFVTILCPRYHGDRPGSYKGIDISSASFNRSNDAEFLERTVQALQMVERLDVRRFRRIQREVRFIVNCELSDAGASYRRTGHVCQVDFRRYDFGRDAEWYLRSYASALVHEATHGAIYSRYVAYTPKSRCAIERLCHTEEHRFVMRLDTPERRWSEQIIRPFDERRWHASWYAGFFRRGIRIGERIVEVKRRA